MFWFKRKNTTIIHQRLDNLYNLLTFHKDGINNGMTLPNKMNILYNHKEECPDISEILICLDTKLGRRNIFLSYVNAANGEVYNFSYNDNKVELFYIYSPFECTNKQSTELYTYPHEGKCLTCTEVDLAILELENILYSVLIKPQQVKQQCQLEKLKLS